MPLHSGPADVTPNRHKQDHSSAELSAEFAILKAKLVQQIRDLIVEKGLTQTQAAKLLGLDQPKVSALVRGRTSGYTTDRLFRFLNLLGQEIDITILPAANNAAAAETRVLVATG